MNHAPKITKTKRLLYRSLFTYYAKKKKRTTSRSQNENARIPGGGD